MCFLGKQTCLEIQKIIDKEKKKERKETNNQLFSRTWKMITIDFKLVHFMDLSN